MQGRFTTPDWAEKPEAVPYADFDDPQSLNLYGYVRNNPINNSDLDGHVCFSYTFDRRADVTVATLDKSLGSSLNDFARKNQRQPGPKELEAIVRAEKVSFGIESHLAKRWLAELWHSVSRVGGSASANALRGDAKREVEVTLDPTMYVIEYTDVDKHFKMSLTGTPAAWIRPADLIHW